MDFESKITSRDISEILWETEKTVSTAESCTGGRIGEAMIGVVGYYKYLDKEFCPIDAPAFSKVTFK